MKGHNFEHGRGDICKKCGKIHIHPDGNLNKKYAYKSRPSMRGDQNPAKRPKVREKIRVSKIGDNNPSKRPEIKKNLSEAKKENWKDPEYYERMCKLRKDIEPWNKGLTRADDERLSQYWLGKSLSKETREKIRVARLNQVFPTKDSSIEIMLQDALKEARLGFVTHYPVTGQPDIAFPDERVAIFCDGCYWHGCPICGFDNPRPHRDKEVTSTLENEGWKVLRFWGHEIRGEIGGCLNQIKQVM